MFGWVMGFKRKVSFDSCYEEILLRYFSMNLSYWGLYYLTGIANNLATLKSEWCWCDSAKEGVAVAAT